MQTKVLSNSQLEMTELNSYCHHVQEELLEEDSSAVQPLSRESPAGQTIPDSKPNSKDPHPWQASWGDLFTEDSEDTDMLLPQSLSDASAGWSTGSNSNLDSANSSDTSPPSGALAATPAPAASATQQVSKYIREETDYSKWTVLREGDGGRHVHELQVALAQNGFWPGDDDMLWWQFGDSTCSAVQTFQV